MHGPIEFDGANIEDFVILRSDGHPTYHLSVVADDVEMEITHVVRGDDHISNTPKQMLLYRALGADVPRFAHVPLILGPDKKRLSKRHGATSVDGVRAPGYLPEAMVNFLAFLGWSPGSGDRELFTRDELVGAFSLEGISGGNAVFNPEKLDWFNQQHIMRLAPDELGTRLQAVVSGRRALARRLLGERARVVLRRARAAEAAREAARRLRRRRGDSFSRMRSSTTTAAVEKHLREDGVASRGARRGASPRSRRSIRRRSKPALRARRRGAGVKAASLIHAGRVAMTGKTVSPGLFDVMALVGRDRVRARLRGGVATAAPASRA